MSADTFEDVRRLVLATAGLAPESAVRRVAAVGNAPLNPDAERAAVIDDSDVVLRVNGFALDTLDGPPTVGRRTNAVVFNRATRATPWLFDRYRERVYLLVEPGRMTWEPEVLPPWWPSDLGLVPVSNRHVTLPLCRELGVDALADGQWATTGTFAAWLAQILFPEAELVLTGYSFVTERTQTRWEHAFGDPCPVGPEHRIDREGELLTSWVAHGRARVLA